MVKVVHICHILFSEATLTLHNSSFLTLFFDLFWLILESRCQIFTLLPNAFLLRGGIIIVNRAIRIILSVPFLEKGMVHLWLSDKKSSAAAIVRIISAIDSANFRVVHLNSCWRTELTVILHRFFPFRTTTYVIIGRFRGRLHVSLRFIIVLLHLIVINLCLSSRVNTSTNALYLVFLILKNNILLFFSFLRNCDGGFFGFVVL